VLHLDRRRVRASLGHLAPTAKHDDVFIRLGDGTAVTDGDVLTGQGIRADAAVLPAWDNRDSQLGAHGRFCDADNRGIVVFDEVDRTDS